MPEIFLFANMLPALNYKYQIHSTTQLTHINFSLSLTGKRPFETDVDGL